MIVISGALVAVALILLIVGLTVTTLNLIYASIAVSAISLICLLVGIFQRRGELPAGDAGTAESTVARAENTSSSAARDAVRTSRVASAASVDAPSQLTAPGMVLVVEGRPRYHVAGCRYLTGKQATEVTVAVAHTDGFTACGVCKPPLAPSDAPAAVDGLDVPFDLIASGPLNLDTLAIADAPAKPVTPVKAAAVAKAVAPRKAPAMAPIATKVAAAVKAPARVPAKRAVKAPVTALAEVTPDLDRVVVIADRTKFHLSDCRFVRGAAGTSLITRETAATQGFVACGVCKP